MHTTVVAHKRSEVKMVVPYFEAVGGACDSYSAGLPFALGVVSHVCSATHSRSPELSLPAVYSVEEQKL